MKTVKKIYVKTVNYADNFYKVTEIDYTYSDGANGIVAKENVNDTYPCIRMKATNVSLSVKTEDVTDFKGGTIQFGTTKDSVKDCKYIFMVKSSNQDYLKDVKIGYELSSDTLTTGLKTISYIDNLGRRGNKMYLYIYNVSSPSELGTDNGKYCFFFGINEVTDFTIRPENVIIISPNDKDEDGKSTIYKVKKSNDVWVKNTPYTFDASQL